MIKAVGERDFSAQEVMHHILSFKLFSSSFQVVTPSLDGSRKLIIKNDELETRPSILDNYANRSSFKGSTSEVLECNFVTFVANYSLVNDELRKRSKSVVIKTYPRYYSNPGGVQYPMFCKYQLIKYKPWDSVLQNVWDNSDVSDEMFCQKWNDFLMSSLGQNLVPNWRRQLFDAESYISASTVNLEDSDDEDQNSHLVREEWMYLADLCTNEDDTRVIDDVDREYWTLPRDKYTLEQIGNMPT